MIVMKLRIKEAKNRKGQGNVRVIQKQTSLKDTGTVLKERGYQEIGLTPGDGNCFFGAVSNQLDMLGHSSTQTNEEKMFVNISAT